MEKMEPLGGRILLRRKTAKQIGSIILPDEAAKRHASLRCTVIECGPACEWDLKPGDDVLIGRLAGTWVNPDGKPITDADEAEYFVVMEDDILLRFDDSEKKLAEIDAEITELNTNERKRA